VTDTESGQDLDLLKVVANVRLRDTNLTNIEVRMTADRRKIIIAPYIMTLQPELHH
jgi:hypothetical protein